MAILVQASELRIGDVPRASTGVAELDWMFGHSVVDGKNVWGMPQGGITLLGGEKGVGKSRLSIAIAKQQIAYGMKVLYFQVEIDLRSFSRWIKGAKNKHLLYCSDAKTLQEQIDAIRQVRPHLVLVDSVNEVEEYNSGSTRDVRTVVSSFREITNSMPIHIMFLVQLNKDGSVKGSSTLPHLVDSELFAMKLAGKVFTVKLGKHRFGPNDEHYWCEWRHNDTGVECISKHRYEDEKWNKTHGITDPSSLQSFVKKKVVAPKKKFLGIFSR